jgi:hypothetical protein
MEKIMNTKEAQMRIAAAIKADAEAVIRVAEDFNPAIRSIVAATRKVPGPVEGVAAIAVRYALRGVDNAETGANMVRFAGLLAA